MDLAGPSPQVRSLAKRCGSCSASDVLFALEFPADSEFYICKNNKSILFIMISKRLFFVFLNGTKNNQMKIVNEYYYRGMIKIYSL